MKIGRGAAQAVRELAPQTKHLQLQGVPSPAPAEQQCAPSGIKIEELMCTKLWVFHGCCVAGPADAVLDGNASLVLFVESTLPARPLWHLARTRTILSP
jgi:hypothetical protein